MSTIYITEPNASFKVQNRYLKISQKEKKRFVIPIRNISQFIIFGNIKLPKDTMQIVRLNQIPALYLTKIGEYIGRIENPSPVQTKYVKYQRQRLRDTEFNRNTVESMIWAKLHNQHAILQGWTYYYTDYTTERALSYLTLRMDNLAIAKSIEELREYMEEADNIYYYALSSLISFYNPSLGTDTKRIFQLFNLGNHLLRQYIYTHLITAGLHPDYSILHSDTYHELPLAWDFAVEFTAPIVDDLVLNFVCNNFSLNGNGNGKKANTCLQKFLQYWEGKLKTFILHPYMGEISYRQCIQQQVKEYISSLLGDINYYRPLVFKQKPTHSQSTKVTKPHQVPLALVKS